MAERGVSNKNNRCVQSILENQVAQGCITDVQIVAVKCSCGSSWCPTCSKRRWAPNAAKRLRALDWRRTRHVVLTVDPGKFESPKAAYLRVKSDKSVAQLIHNLKRTAGIRVSNWIWFLEWHEDGRPHWHLFIEMERRGAADMLGVDTLGNYWPHGYVTEHFSQTKTHWQALTGTLSRKGYFENKKAYQSRLPQWAMTYDRSIRRFGAMVLRKQSKSPRSRSKGFSGKGKKDLGKLNRGRKNTGKGRAVRTRKKYREILEVCGKRTNIRVKRAGIKYWIKLFISYSMFRKSYEGEFVKGKGYVVNLHDHLFYKLLLKFSSPYPS